MLTCVRLIYEMSSTLSSDKSDLGETTESEIDSNADELLMLEQLKINENEVIDNTKELRQKILLYEQKIKELNEELISQGSLSDNLKVSIGRYGNTDDITENQAGEIINSNQNSQLTITISQSNSNDHTASRKEKNPNQSSLEQHPNFFIPQSILPKQTNYPQTFNRNPKTSHDMFQYINDFEDFIQNKCDEADKILSSLVEIHT